MRTEPQLMDDIDSYSEIESQMSIEEMKAMAKFGKKIQKENMKLENR